MAGPDHEAEDESTAASIPAGGATLFSARAGLPALGSTVGCRVYAITAEGNERPRNTVSVTGP